MLGTFALGLASGLATAAQAETLTSARIDVGPSIDGVVEDAWAAAEPLSLVVDNMPYEPSNGYEGIKQSTVIMRAMHDDGSVYFLLEWKDPTQSLERQPWVKQADGSWKQLSNKDDTGHENTYYEDKLALLWDINARGFEKKGCAAACHMADNGMVNGIAAGAPGRKFTAGDGQTIDMWHWKGVRSAPVGQFDDQFIDNTADPEQNENWGRKGDSKTGGGYANNRNDDKSAPAFMPADGSTGTFWLLEADAVPFEDRFAEGDVLPGIIVSPFAGSRGDITAEASWADGKWTLEVARPLVDVDAVKRKYTESLLVGAMWGSMYEHVTEDESIHIVERWIAAGMPEDIYKSEVAPVMAEDCTNCHSRSSTMSNAMPSIPLTSFEDVLAFSPRGLPDGKLLRGLHFHLFGIGTALLALGLLLAITDLSGFWKGLLPLTGFIGLWLDTGGWLAGRVTDAAAYMIIAGGTLVNASLAAMAVLVLLDCWIRVPLLSRRTHGDW